MSPGSRRLDLDGAVKAHLGAQKVSFAGRDAATALTGMAFGGITAFGPPGDWRVPVDAAVTDRSEAPMGACVRAARLVLPPAVLAALPTAEVAPLARAA